MIPQHRLLLLACAMRLAFLDLEAVAGTPDECIVQSVRSGDRELTAEEILVRCTSKAERTSETPGSLGDIEPMGGVIPRYSDEIFDQVSLHLPSYIVATGAREPSNATTQDDGSPWNEGELMFQISIKAPVWRRDSPDARALFFAYTNRSWWQVAEDSAPFREINHEPELFLRKYFANRSLGQFELMGVDLGINHQSNGRAGASSRSWNRLIFSTTLQREDLALLLRTWYRLPASADSNPQMQRYLGYGELQAVYAPGAVTEGNASPPNTYSLLLRPGTRKISVEATWSRRIGDSDILRFYAQYFSGYGDSLIDYDRRVTRFGIGVSLNEFTLGTQGIPKPVD